MHFEMAFKYVIENEGEYDNDPTDKGGETNWGITKERATIHRCFEHPSGLNIKDVNLKVAKHIYLTDYWKFDAIDNISIAIKLFDYAVNFGPIAVHLAQEAVNELGGMPIKVDGIIGRITADRINSLDPLVFLDTLEKFAGDRYCDIVINDFKRTYGNTAFNKLQLKFLKGWIRRLNKRFYGSIPLIGD